MRLIITALLCLSWLSLSRCIGTDYIDDPIIGEEISVSHQTIALTPGEQVQLMATYYDQYGIERNAPVSWISTRPSVADVGESGLVTANADGQTIVQPSVDNFLGPQIQVTVVRDASQVATVEIAQPNVTSLEVGQELLLEAVVRNIEGDELPNENIEWFSENGNILAVTQTGLVTAMGPGTAGIHAKSNNVKSNSINLSVVGYARTGTFASAGGYHTSGSTQLELKNGELILTLSSDFDTDFVLGTYIYLANTTNGPMVRSSGFQVSQVFSDGAMTFNINQLNPSIGLNDYKYVISLCYPASATFGYAELK